MVNPLTWLSRRRFPYEPLISIEISRHALTNNLDEFRKLAPNHSIAPVLKSNAYGHGLFDVARILENHRRGTKDARNTNGSGTIPFFIIDSYFEAVALRSQGIKTPLLVIGYTRPGSILSSTLNNVAFTIGSLESLQELEDTEHPIGIHLKIDTGMRRQGILPEEIPAAIQLLAENTNLILLGICSHLSDADNDDPSYSESQINIWNRTVSHFKNEFPSLKYIHLGATHGHRFTPDIDANVSRLGLGLYGLVDGASFPQKLNLIPALHMKTVIASVKKVKRDDSVGYSGTFRADRDMTIAIIPVGYYEGIDRRLSNNGFVGVGRDNISCPIIGNVSMNMTAVDISKVQNVEEGMEVTVFSNINSADNSIVSLSKRSSVIPYELAVHIPSTLKRTVVG
ncbi:MAG: alanine racemase [Candidatus Taylorbacteria bacterium]